MTHEEHKELIPLAALGTTDGREQAALDAHLATCGECRAELRSLADTAALLALDAAPVAPRPELRSRVLSEIKSIRQETAATAATAAHAETTRPANVVSLEEARSARRREGDEGRGAAPARRPTLLYGALAASLVVAALSVVFAVAERRENNRLQAVVAQVSRQLADTRSQLEGTTTELARARFESELLAAPDSRTADLTGTAMAQTARAKLVFSDATGEAILVAAKLPPAPAGKAYQLWYIAGGKPLPGSVFTTDRAGRGELRERIPPAGRRAEVFAVTLEPEGGLPAPSGEIYLKGSAL
jgi:hypothetical protein